MKGFDKLHVKSAVKAHNKFDLSRTHLTTAEFGQIIPLMYEETIPGDKFNIQANFFSRLAPLVTPTYGKFSFKTVSIFVPYYQVADDVEAWLDGLNTWEGSTPDSRYITVADLALLATDASLGSVVNNASTGDFKYYSNGTLTTTRFNTFGKYVFKVLNSLGYALPQGADVNPLSSWSSSGYGTTKLSALPLLAFFKAYNDWMSQSTRYNTSILTNVLRCIRHNTSVTGYNTTYHTINSQCLKNMFSLLRLAYDNDYFTSAWMRANSPLNTVSSKGSFQVPGPISASNNFDTLVQNEYGTKLQPYVTTQIFQRSLDFLKSFDDWVRRNNYSGSRAVQQVYSRFGIKTEDYRSNYAHLIDTDSQPVQVGDVTSTTDSAASGGVELGAYAGKGIMSGNKGLSFDSKDYGCLFVFGYFTVRPMMSYGSDKAVLRNQPFDYYNPEFDGLGAEAISYAEIFQDPLDPSTATGVHNDAAVYGFTERYNSYRYGRDKITGDFRHYDQNEMNSWHTGRLLTDVRAGGNMVAQSTAMNTLSATDSEYNRMFANTSGSHDHFYLTAQFNISAVRPILNLNQVPRLGEGDTEVARNGNVVS